jgi:hypothetical protein
MHGVAYRVSFLRNISYQQTEGLLYTDNEWRLLPWMQACKVAHFPFAVYRYLLGREGQSMSPSIWRRNAKDQVYVVKRLMGGFNEHRPQLALAQRELLERELRHMIDLVYGALFYHVPLRMAIPWLVELDAKLKDVSMKNYSDLENETCLNRIFPIRYVSIFRNHASCRAPLPALMRCVQRLSSSMAKIA